MISLSEAQSIRGSLDGKEWGQGDRQGMLRKEKTRICANCPLLTTWPFPGGLNPFTSGMPTWDPNTLTGKVIPVAHYMWAGSGHAICLPYSYSLMPHPLSNFGSIIKSIPPLVQKFYHPLKLYHYPTVEEGLVLGSNDLG